MTAVCTYDVVRRIASYEGFARINIDCFESVSLFRCLCFCERGLGRAVTLSTSCAAAFRVHDPAESSSPPPSTGPTATTTAKGSLLAFTYPVAEPIAESGVDQGSLSTKVKVKALPMRILEEIKPLMHAVCF
jgi:hypothetical protein